VAREGLEPENVYPNTFFLPESGIQRGSICAGLGDPLSPDWTSIKGKSKLDGIQSEIDRYLRKKQLLTFAKFSKMFLF
jgi:hypothetical protein